MSKEKRAVTLVVEEPGHCSLVKPGDSFALVGKDLTSPRGGHMCARAVCSIFPQVEEFLKTLEQNAALPNEQFICGGCGATFRIKPPEAKDQSGMFTMPSMRRKADRAFLGGGGDTLGPGQLEKSASGRAAPFMQRLPLDLRDELQFIGKPVKFNDGESVIHQGVEIKLFHILTHGMASVVTRRNNDESLIGSVNEGEFFGEYAMVAGIPSDYEVRAVGNCTVLTIPRKEFLQLVAKRTSLLRIMSRMIAEKVKAASATVENELNRGILGKLSMIPLVDLVQTLNQSRRSGSLVIHNQSAQAFVVFLNGAVISCVCGTRKGEDAFYHILEWKTGEFCFEPCEPFEQMAEREGAIESDTMKLMMEGARRMDETPHPDAPQPPVTGAL